MIGADLTRGRENNQIQLGKRGLQTTTACPKVAFGDSYSFTYLSTSALITPTFTLACSGVNFQMRTGYFNNYSGLSLNTTTKSVAITSWSQFSNNQFYNVTMKVDIQNQNTLEIVTISDYFILTIGTQTIQYTPLGYIYLQYKDPATLLYQNAFDPQQSKTGVLSYSFSCSSILTFCSTLTNGITIDAMTRVKNQWAYDYQYKINVTIANKASQYAKQSVDQVTLKIVAPEESGLTPENCIDFTLNIRNQNYTVNRIQYTQSLIIYDNLNFTDLRLYAPTVNMTRCYNSYGNSINYYAAINQNNPNLFNDPRTFLFNSSDVLVSRANIQSILMVNSTQQFLIYVFLYNTALNQIFQYYAHTVTLQKNQQSLFAVITQNFIQVDSGKILYIDGSTSYDTRYSNISYNYTWLVAGSSAVFSNQKILTLTPAQRNASGINQAGKYYAYTLQVSDSTRSSNIATVTVQISPGLDPQGCYQVSLKDIDLQTIITYTNLPFVFLQARVVKNTACQNVVTESLVWGCQTLNWQFWALFGNNNTISLERSNLQLLPKNQNILMSVTQYYTINAIEYIAQDIFTLLVAKSDLVPVVIYPKVINLHEKLLVLNGTGSYDPQAESSGTTNVPVICNWICPIYMNSLCQTASISQNNCLLSFSSSAILSSPIYDSQIKNQAHLFTLNITKDTRLDTAYVYVTIIDSNSYPKCQIDFLQPLSVNSYAFLNATCFNQSAAWKYSYQWAIYSWQGSQQVDLLSLQTYENQQILRIPPYILSTSTAIRISLLVTNQTFTTPINLYSMINDQSGFTIGSITKNYNQFTSYLSTLIVTPANWGSTISQTLSYQYRIQIQSQKYKLLLSPTIATSSTPISTILPPISYENSLYFDVLDTDSNYVTVKQSIISNPDVLMTAATFLSKVTAIINSVVYNFDENVFEINIMSLMLYFQAYREGYINMGGVPNTYFRSLCENTVYYLYNAITIDQRLSSILSNDRAILIRQNIIELLSFIAVNNQEITNGNTFFILLNYIMNSGQIYLSNTFDEICMKVYQSVLFFGQYAYNPMGDNILQNLQTQIQYYLYPDESLNVQQFGYTFLSYEIPATITNFPNIIGFSYPQALVSMTKFIGGTLTLMRNDTFVLAQIYDSTKTPQLIQGLSNPVNITFYLSSIQLQRQQVGNLTFYCYCRQDNSQSWSNATSKIYLLYFDIYVGQVTCRSFIMGQFSLFINDLTLINTGSSANNQTVIVINPNVGDQNVSGIWNTSISPNDGTVVYLSSEDVFIYNDERVVIMIVAILTLCFFVLSSIGFYCWYKNEHQNIQKIEDVEDFQNISYQTSNQNRLRLFKKIMINFNPYLNLFMIYNKFLKRWVRCSLLQIYFMTISLIYGINACLLSKGYSQLGNLNQIMQIFLYFISIVLILLGRPLAIKLFYKLLYEPDSKVEDFDYLTSQTQAQGQIKNVNNLEIQIQNSQEAQIHQIINFDKEYDLDLQKKNPQQIVVLPKMFDQDHEFINNQDFEIVGGDARNNLQNTASLTMISNQINISQNVENQDQEEEKKEQDRVEFGMEGQIYKKTEIQEEEKLKYFSNLPPINSTKNKILGNRLTRITEIKQKRLDKKRNKQPAVRMNQISENDSLIDSQNVNPNILQSDLMIGQNQLEKYQYDYKFDEINDQINIDQDQEQNQNQYQLSNRIQNQFELPDINQASKRQMFSQIFKDEIFAFDQNQPQNEMTEDDQMQDLYLQPSAEVMRQLSNPLIKSSQKNQDLPKDNQIQDDQEEFNEINFYDMHQDNNSDKEKLEDSIIYEGGDQEQLQLEDIDQIPDHLIQQNTDQFEDQQNTMLQQTQIQQTYIYNTRENQKGQKQNNQRDNIILQNISDILQGPFSVNQSDQIKNSADLNLISRNQDGLFQQNSEQDSMVQEQHEDQSVLVDDNKKCFVNKYIGKLILLLIWVGLVVFNMICIENMRRKYFKTWLILSLVTFFSIVFIFDVIIYFVLSCFMIKSSQNKKLQFHLRRQSSFSWARVFVNLLIGKEKMRDLRRNLNPKYFSKMQIQAKKQENNEKDIFGVQQ